MKKLRAKNFHPIVFCLILILGLVLGLGVSRPLTKSKAYNIEYMMYSDNNNLLNELFDIEDYQIRILNNNYNTIDVWEELNFNDTFNYVVCDLVYYSSNDYFENELIYNLYIYDDPSNSFVEYVDLNYENIYSEEGYIFYKFLNLNNEYLVYLENFRFYYNNSLVFQTENNENIILQENDDMYYFEYDLIEFLGMYDIFYQELQGLPLGGYTEQEYQQAITNSYNQGVASVDTESYYQNGFDNGYAQIQVETGTSPFFENIFNQLGSLLSIEIFPRITIGLIVFLPIILGLVVIVIKFIRG